MSFAFKNFAKNLFFIIFIFLLLSALFSLISPGQKEVREISITQLARDINENKIRTLEIEGDKITAKYTDEEIAQIKKEPGSSLFAILESLGTNKESINKIEIKVREGAGNWILAGSIIIGLLPLLFLGWFFWMMFRQAKMGAMQTMDFTKTKARLFGAEGHPKEKILFKDVAGLKEVKEELIEVVDFLKNPQKYLKMGAKIPKGVLLVGSAGVGKTMLARAVAGESNVPFFSISGSEFVELFVGVGAARVRSLFQEAKKKQPSILFVDELDAIGKTRGPAIIGGHEEREQTLNQLLVEMDGFEAGDRVIVLAATNRPDVLDTALLRPGRFDRKVILDLPDIQEREEILKIHCHNKPLSQDVALRELAERTPGFSGADLANLVNEAAIFAARLNQKEITQKNFLESFEKVLLGPEKKSKVLSEKEKKICAYHEAGHALVALNFPETGPVRKVSIVARGFAAGYTLKLPSEDKKLKTKKGFFEEIAVLLGGYLTEKLIFKDLTTGASNDLEIASEIARKLVKEYGMSDKFGPIVFGKKEGGAFFGKDFGEEKNYSEKIAEEIDSEVGKIIKNAQIMAYKILERERKTLEKIAEVLIKKETLEKEELEALVKKPKEMVKKGT